MKIKCKDCKNWNLEKSDVKGFGICKLNGCYTLPDFHCEEGKKK